MDEDQFVPTDEALEWFFKDWPIWKDGKWFVPESGWKGRKWPEVKMPVEWKKRNKN